jgi:GxxExxY protein
MDHGIHGTHGKLIHADETFAVRGAVFEVYKILGAGFLEAVYQECLALEFSARDIPFKATPQLGLSYKGVRLRHGYSPDFICFDRLILEIKAAREIAPEHRAQIMNYLRATGLQIGLLVNFGAARGVQIERFAL